MGADSTVGETATYHVRIENDGLITHTFTVSGTAGAGAWNVIYRDDGGIDITADVTDVGWSTGRLSHNEAVNLTVEVTPNTVPSDSPTYSVLVAAASSGRPYRADAVRADTSTNGAYRIFLPLVAHDDGALRRSEGERPQ